MTASMLSLDQVVTGYGDMEIVHGISVQVLPRSITALVGANGAGKTTLMLMLSGVLPVFRGQVTFDGSNATQARSHQRVEAGMVLVPEGRKVFPSLTIEENLRLGAIAPRARASWQQRRDEMFALFPKLHERRGQLAGTLSGGEQQMLAIARGLMSRPKLLLLDEPTLGLAPIMARYIFDTIQKLSDEGLTILISEQDTQSTLKIASHAYVVENGRIALSGSGDEVSRDPRVQQAYLGL